MSASEDLPGVLYGVVGTPHSEWGMFEYDDGS